MKQCTYFMGYGVIWCLLKLCEEINQTMGYVKNECINLQSEVVGNILDEPCEHVRS